MPTYPNDEDGAVLKGLAAQGIDMSRPLQIEFAVAVPDEKTAKAVASALSKQGYQPQVEHDPGEPDEDGEIDADDEEFGPSWTVFVNISMVPTYAEVVRIQADLDRLARPLGGASDGWGVLLG